MCRWFHHIEHDGAHEILLGLHDLDGNQFPGQCPTDERNPSVVDPSDRISPCRHLLGTHHYRRHRRRL